MDNIELNKTLRHMARNHGLCDAWYGEWRNDTTNDELLNMYVRGIDFSINNDWITNDFAKEHFTEEELAEHGIFFDKQELKEYNLPNLILNGSCSGIAEYNHFSVGNVYVRHKSKVKITVWDFAKCFIEVYDNAEVEVINYANNRVFVYQHGGNVKTKGDVLVRKK